MVINKVLENIFSAPSKIAVLRILNEREIGISGREVSRLTGLSIRAAQISLSDLGKAGIVMVVEGNREYLFSIDREKYLVKELVEKIFAAEREYKSRIISTIKNRLKPFTLSLIQFGSTVRNEETLSSDFDLCVIYKKDLAFVEEKVSELRALLMKSYNVTLAPLYLSSTKFRQMGKQGKSPVNSILKEGKIIAGKSINELLYG